MTSELRPFIKQFSPISLRELNARAALLDREENKYLLDAGQFTALTAELSQRFDILDISGNNIFDYKSTYFDTQELLGYNYHHQGRIKRRFKIRTREYVDSGLCYFEVKLKNKRGGTIKKRIPYRIAESNTITDQAQAFLKSVYREVYNEPFDHQLSARLTIDYSRITLVAKTGHERMTIDFNLSFANQETTTPVRQMIIVETKSNDGRGIADAILKNHGIRSVSCSKFCLGANLVGYKVKSNRFKPLLKRYGELPLAQV